MWYLTCLGSILSLLLFIFTHSVNNALMNSTPNSEGEKFLHYFLNLVLNQITDIIALYTFNIKSLFLVSKSISNLAREFIQSNYLFTFLGNRFQVYLPKKIFYHEITSIPKKSSKLFSQPIIFTSTQCEPINF
eukprot:TRINITY_DN1538_c0_g3_i2.p1 TRINITY_DN1538_c0_g3~~TRINITY_DN1538_c0_g3_i2.p1  ORF type:complete len:133 (+),score=19.20 TRINITY_DN1538_c0_g3_i2:245-643(+)